MKKWWNASMLVALSCLMALAVTAAPVGTAPVGTAPVGTAPDDTVPDGAAVDAAVPEIAPPAEDATELPRLGLERTAEVEAASYSAARITCTFHCNDGIGFLYDCPESTLGACCAAAQPACEEHEGLESGICRKGRLGLPCIPL